MNIALIGLSTLHAYGLRTLIEREFAGHSVSIYADTSDPRWQQADGYIVSASALAILARFLMSRLDCVMLLTFSAPDAAPMQMLSPLASEEEIIAAITSLTENIGIHLESASGSSNIVLSPREIDVLRLTAAGDTSRQIADKLCISTNTVLTHRKNIAAKTGLHTVSAITHYAMVHGLLH